MGGFTTSRMEPIIIQIDCAGGASGEIRERVKANGVVRQIMLRFYTGQQLDLHIMPFVMHTGKRREDLVTYPEGARQYLSGEDDQMVIPTQVNVYYDDEIVVRYENQDPDNTYTVVVYVHLDYTIGSAE